MFGIIQSLITTSISAVLWYVSQASEPSLAATHSCPRLSTMLRSILRETASSSAINTFNLYSLLS
jgi:hypothetical protein